MAVKNVPNIHVILMIVVRHGIVVNVNIINGGKMEDNRICLFYVTKRLMDLNKIADRRKGAIGIMEKLLKEFEKECVYNLGINALHNHNNQWRKNG